jgi:hypothetical protein
MKRITILAALALLVPAASAHAAPPKPGAWTGTKVQLGNSLEFTVKAGKITEISANVLEYCDGETTSSWTTFAPDSSWKVRNGRFSGRHKETFDGVTAYFTFKGRFTGATSAKGKLREETIVAGSVCDTRELAWTAKAG